MRAEGGGANGLAQEVTPLPRQEPSAIPASHHLLFAMAQGLLRTGWGESRLTVVCMENNTIISK